MDLMLLNPQAASDTAIRVVLINPFTNDSLLDSDGKEMAAHIVGMESTLARNIDAKHRRESPKPDKAVDDMTTEEQESFLEELQAFGKTAGAEKLAAMTTKLEGNWQIGDKKVKASDKASLAKLYAELDWLADQLISVSRELSNYGPKT